MLWAAPRGDAKSTKISMSFAAWCVVTEKLWYPIIVMDAFEQAAEMLEAIKAELEANPRIGGDFPEVFGQGKVWRAGVIVTRNGPQGRGLRFGQEDPGPSPRRAPARPGDHGRHRER